MSKKSSRRFSKKGLVGLVRVNTPNGRRFVYNGRQFETLREVVTVHWADQIGIKL